MNGLKWLGGKKWSEVTRDERFFCAHLYKKILEHAGGITHFVRVLNESCGLNLPVDANWELGYEVVFYRDMWFEDPERFEMVSGKRTFDLCLFSDGMIVIIEAKAFQEFDKGQVDCFMKDKKYIQENLGLPVEVLLVPLASSRYGDRFEKSGLADSFDCRLLTWKALAGAYDTDKVLSSADAIFGCRPKGGGVNEGFVEGNRLVELYRSNTVNPNAFWIGRGEGLGGLSADVQHNEWRERLYQTNGSMAKPPNRNWFSLAAFSEAVGEPTEEPLLQCSAKDEPMKMVSIGIFWVHQGQVLGKAVDLSRAEEGVPGLLDSPDSHSDVWDIEERWLAIYPELREQEYFEVPRGRVLWRKDPPAAIVYMDAKLFSEEMKAKIAEFFDLADCRILWQTDPHYTTHP